jgi:hypothetical protein
MRQRSNSLRRNGAIGRRNCVPILMRDSIFSVVPLGAAAFSRRGVCGERGFADPCRVHVKNRQSQRGYP